MLEPPASFSSPKLGSSPFSRVLNSHHARVVNLSGCRTSSGKAQRRLGVQGLARTGQSSFREYRGRRERRKFFDVVSRCEQSTNRRRSRTCQPQPRSSLPGEVLFDQGVLYESTCFEVSTAFELGWNELSNSQSTEATECYKSTAPTLTFGEAGTRYRLSHKIVQYAAVTPWYKSHGFFKNQALF